MISTWDPLRFLVERVVFSHIQGYNFYIEIFYVTQKNNKPVFKTKLHHRRWKRPEVAKKRGFL